MNHLKFLPFVAATIALAATAAHADLAYTTPGVLSGNQAFFGPFGMDFDINTPTIITGFGLYDADADGFASSTPNLVTLYNRDTETAVASLTFGGGTGDGTLVPGTSDRVKPLGIGISLGAGFHGVIVADYGDTDQLNNVGGGGPAPTTNDLGGAISFVGLGRYTATEGAFPTTIDGGPPNRFNGPTFDAVPEPASLLGVLCGAAAVLCRRRR